MSCAITSIVDLMDLACLGPLLSINGLAFVLICACYTRMYISIARQQMANYYNGMPYVIQI